jgi:malate dehydrogenase (quinone)
VEVTLTEKAAIPEGDGYGGFPVSGQWLKMLQIRGNAKHQSKYTVKLV